ncbi:MAG TPA: cytochrome P450 [Candidatus Binatia bacterium]|nr:cytochrome P450 [Candidatus Binatia bacterium]
MELSEIDLVNPDTWMAGVPHEAFRVLRERAPMFWQDYPGSQGFWAVTKYEDVVAISKDPATFSSHRGSALLRDMPAEDLAQTQLMMLNMDPPQHSKYRKLVSQGFTPRMTTRLEPRIREMAVRILDRVTPIGRCDFVRDIAAELPLQVIAELIGVPMEDRDKVFDWSNRLIGFDDPEFGTSEEKGKEAAAELWMYANALAEQRKKEPRDDLVSTLIHGEVDGEKLSEMEFDSFFLLLAVAGNETTRNLIAGGMHALIEHPDQWRRLRENPELINTAVEEMLRWVTPVIHFRRTVMRPTQIRGVQLNEGDKVAIYYTSANRDEDVFPNAMTFDVGRTPNNHVAFGIGEHFCLGANLARLEIRAIFEELVRRVPDMELAAPVRRLRSNFINGTKEMQVRFTPTPAVAA